MSLVSLTRDHRDGTGGTRVTPDLHHGGEVRAEVAGSLRSRTAPRISGNCAWHVVEGEAVLLDLHGKRLAGLNAVGSFVFPLLDGARTLEELAAAIVERFNVGCARAESDLRAFLSDLARRGFVEGIEP